jgi:hypothetical protein
MNPPNPALSGEIDALRGDLPPSERLSRPIHRPETGTYGTFGGWR